MRGMRLLLAIRRLLRYARRQAWMLRFARAQRLLGAAVVLLVAGCAAPAPAPGPITVQIGTTTMGDAGFQLLTEAGPCELLAGYQGLLFLPLRYLATGASGRVFVNAHVEIAGEVPTDQGRTIVLNEEPGVGLVSETHIVLLDQPIATLIGKTAVITATVTAGAASGTGSIRVILRDDDPCIDQGGGTCALPEAGTADDPDAG